MSRLRVTILLSLCSLALWASSASANLITFENLSIDRLDLAGVQVEGEFSYFATGIGWEVVGSRGNPPSMLATFWDDEDSTTGDFVDIFMSKGGLFYFNSVEFATPTARDRAPADDVRFIGLLGGVEIDSFRIDTDSILFRERDPHFEQPIDRLRVQVARKYGFAGTFLDNINLTPEVPAPSTVPLFAMGLACLGWVRRRVNDNFS